MAQQNKTTLQSAINAQIADNTSGAITAANVRNNFINLTDSLVFNTGSQAITGSLTVTGGVTGSLLGTATNALTASYLNNAPIIQSFGGKWLFQDTYGSQELNQTTSSTALYSSRIFSTAVHNYWMDLSVSLHGPGSSGTTTTLKLYASANGSTLDALLGTYTIASGSVRDGSVNKMQRTFWMSGVFAGEEQVTNYFIYGATPSVSLKSDELSTGSQSTTLVGTNVIDYPYLVITGESTAIRVYRLGPSRITYG